MRTKWYNYLDPLNAMIFIPVVVIVSAFLGLIGIGFKGVNWFEFLKTTFAIIGVISLVEGIAYKILDKKLTKAEEKMKRSEGE